ncbi:MAG TPA: diguanylate cyclase, partial [Acidimicrobiales bacterium]|nr:diguanylate cyclase [Acidimicrobiales bacterium]
MTFVLAPDPPGRRQEGLQRDRAVTDTSGMTRSQSPAKEARTSDHLRRSAPVALSVLVILVVAGFGFAATRAAENRSQSVHIADRVQEQRTLAGLGTDYVLFGFKEEINYATTHDWSLASNDPADVALLAAYAEQSALLHYGAALVNLTTGSYISSAALTTSLPPLSDPGFAPMLESLQKGGPGLSLVMHVGSIPLVAYGVPLQVDGTTVGFVGFSPLLESPLESYVTHLHFGSTGLSYVVDSHGVAIAASRPSLVGRALAPVPPLVDLARGKQGFIQYGAGQNTEIATFDPIGLGGWGALTTQSASEFFGPIRSSILLVEGVGALLLVVVGAILAVFIHRRQVSLRRENKTINELAEARERFRHAFEETPVGMALVSIDEESRGRFLQVNRALCHLTGFCAPELLEHRLSGLVHPDNAVELRQSADRLFSGSANFELELRLATHGGPWVWALVHGSLVRDTAGTPLYGVVHIEDISGRKAAEERLSHLALHDPLTNLANRVLIAENLRKALATAARYGTVVAVLYLDLDNFKEVNDRWGHEAGDSVLQEVARRLKEAVRPEDTPGRLGGDEFVVICTGITEAEGAMAIAERIEGALSRPIAVGADTVSIRVSIGI